MAAPRHPLPALERLVRRFSAQRPLRTGSLLMTLFGDAIVPRGGCISLGSLIRLAEPFGLAERLVRTSVARLAVDGWLTASRRGRRSEYRLTDTGHGIFAEATQRIYAVSPTDWSGRWTLWVVPPDRGGRGSLRERSASVRSRRVYSPIRPVRRSRPAAGSGAKHGRSAGCSRVEVKG